MRNFFVTVVVIAAIAAGGYFFWKQQGGIPAGLPLEKLTEQIETAALAELETPLAEETAFKALADALSGVLTTTYDGYGETGATGVVITFADMPEAGVKMDSLSLYGTDAAALEASLDAGDWAELMIAERIDARGIEVFGLDELSEKIIMTMLGETGQDELVDLSAEMDPDSSLDHAEAALSEIENSMAELDGEDMDMSPHSDLPFSFNKYAFAADRMVIDGLTIYPLTDAGAETEGVMAIVAKAADIYRTSGYERAAIWNMTSEIEVAADPMVLTVVSATAFTGNEGWDRGDIGVAVGTGITSSTTQSITIYGDDPMVEVSESSIEAYGVRDIRLAALLGYLAGGQLPPTTETDIVSLGTWAIEGQTSKTNGHLIKTVDEMTMDLSAFHWLIPTHMGVAVSGETYDIQGIVDYATTSEMLGLGDMTVEQRSMLNQALTILKNHDLMQPTLDYQVALGWAPDSGESGLDIDAALRGEIVKIMDLDMVLPTYEQFVAVERLENGYVNPEALAPVFLENSAFAYYQLSLEDLGFVGKLFSMIIEGAKMVPADQNPQAASIAAQSPEQLRQLAGGLLRASAMSMTSQFPPAVEYLSSVAGFIESGGTLYVTAAPEEPVTYADFMEVVNSPEMTPTSIINLINLTITHEAPDGDADDETSNEL